MAVAKEQVQPTVVVKIEELCAPSTVRKSNHANAAVGGAVLKLVRTHVLIDCSALIYEVRDEDIHQSIAIVVAHRETHRPLSIAKFIDGCARLEAGVNELSLAIVDVIEIRSGIIGDVDVLIPVIVKVREHDCKTTTRILASDARRFADVVEGTVAIVVV